MTGFVDDSALFGVGGADESYRFPMWTGSDISGVIERLMRVSFGSVAGLESFNGGALDGEAGAVAVEVGGVARDVVDAGLHGAGFGGCEHPVAQVRGEIAASGAAVSSVSAAAPFCKPWAWGDWPRFCWGRTHFLRKGKTRRNFRGNC